MRSPEKMKIQTAPNGFDIEFPGGGKGAIKVPEIQTIDIETLPTMTVDVDYVILGYASGDSIEITDDAEGFQEFCVELSTALLIDPPIHFRFPVTEGTGIIRVYERDENKLGESGSLGESNP